MHPIVKVAQLDKGTFSSITCHGSTEPAAVVSVAAWPAHLERRDRSR